MTRPSFTMLLCFALGLFLLSSTVADQDATKTQIQQSLLVSAPVTRVAHSSQQATELLVIRWNDLHSWVPGNDTSTICEQDVERTMAAYVANEMWALQMFDAWAKPGPSLLEGRSAFVGNYLQCRGIVSPGDHKREGFSGNYCVVSLANLTHTPSANMFHNMGLMQVLLGTCMPDSCSQEEVTAVFNRRLQELNLTQFLKATSTDCRSDVREYTKFTQIAILIVVVVGILAVLGTIIDLWSVLRPGWTKSGEGGKKEASISVDKQTKSTSTCESQGLLGKVLLSFSIYTNGRRLLSTSQPPGSLNVISGIRFITMSWIVIGHTFYLFLSGNASNGVQGTDSLLRVRIFDVISNMSLGVDTFFAISGLLVSYLTMKHILLKGWQFDWKHFYLHRYWRLTPTLLIVFILIQGLQRFVVSGAMAPTLQPTDKVACERNWWLLPLYISNTPLATNFEDFCFAHTWSLAADFQYYVLSPLMLVPFYYHKYAGIASCLSFIIAQWVIAGVLNYQIGGIIGLGNSFEWFQYVYFPSYSRIAPFSVGIFAGYVLSTNNGRVSMTRSMVVIGWLVATAAAISIIFGVHGDLSGESPSSLFVTSVYTAVHRTIWGACVCWVIIACASGYGGPVNSFLSWSPFIVLGRLTYIGYLVQLSVSSIIFQNLEQPQYMNMSSIIVFGTIDVIFTSAVSAILLLFVELPTLNLEKVLREKNKTQ